MKKVLALVLAAMLILSIAPMTSAATTTYGISSDYASLKYAVQTKNFDDLEAPPVRRDNKAQINLYLTDGSGNLLTKSDVRDLKLDVKTRYSEGSKAVDSVSIQYASNVFFQTDANNQAILGADGKKIFLKDAAYVRIRFVEKFVSTGDLDYKFKVYLTENKKTTDREWEFEGTIENEKQDAYEDYDYLYMFDAPVVDTKEYIKSTELDTGVGLSIFAKLFEGKKYYAYGSQKVQAADDAVLLKYPAIGTVYYLDTIGLNSTGTTIKLDISDKMYVYNADMEYIGTTADKLPYSTKYYVADAELDVADADTDVDEGPTDTDTGADTNPDMGGDDVPENVNDNPGTGC